MVSLNQNRLKVPPLTFRSVRIRSMIEWMTCNSSSTKEVSKEYNMMAFVLKGAHTKRPGDAFRYSFHRKRYKWQYPHEGMPVVKTLTLTPDVQTVYEVLLTVGAQRDVRNTS